LKIAGGGWEEQAAVPDPFANRPDRAKNNE
jgi:hypothetical protein